MIKGPQEGYRMGKMAGTVEGEARRLLDLEACVRFLEVGRKTFWGHC